MTTFWTHSIMMEKSAQLREGGGCTPTSFHYDYYHILYKVVVYAPAEREGTLLYFCSTPIFTLCSELENNVRERYLHTMGSHTVDTQGLAYQLDRMQITNSSRGGRMPVQWAGLYCVRIMQKYTNG
jgi:hypothetical protein